eukprot:2657537-Rhodomonas_salina.4
MAHAGSVPEALDHPRGDGNHVLDRPPDLHSLHVARTGYEQGWVRTRRRLIASSEREWRKAAISAVGESRHRGEKREMTGCGKARGRERTGTERGEGSGGEGGVEGEEDEEEEGEEQERKRKRRKERKKVRKTKGKRKGKRKKEGRRSRRSRRSRRKEGEEGEGEGGERRGRGRRTGRGRGRGRGRRRGRGRGRAYVKARKVSEEKISATCEMGHGRRKEGRRREGGGKDDGREAERRRARDGKGGREEGEQGWRRVSVRALPSPDQ